MKKGLNPVAKLFQGSVTVCLLFGGSVAVFGQQAPQGVLAEPKVANVQVATAVAEHPLVPVLNWAQRERPNIVAIKDYTATMQKQECVDGVVQEAQVMEIKVRHEPFSAYLKFRYPKKINGQEAIWIPSQNKGKLIGHGVGLEKKFGTQFLDPEGFFAMRGNKYSIKEVGLLNLVDKLLEVGYKDSKFGECEVTYYSDNIKVADRECTLIQITHPIPRKDFIFYVARIYVDKELNLPVRYESYDWPQKEGEKEKLIEAYIYSNLKINVGLTDADFDYKNPAYGYPQ